MIYLAAMIRTSMVLVLVHELFLAPLTSMKREMLMMAWSVSLNTSLQVRAVPGGRRSSACLDRKLEMSATVQSVSVS